MKVTALLANGFEEVECLAVVDVLRRAGIDTEMLSITKELNVTGSHNITVHADGVLEADKELSDVYFLPGGLPGTTNLGADETVRKTLLRAYEAGKRLAAICAAPSVLGQLGLLEGKTATCFPGFEDQLKGAEYTRIGVVTDGQITTGRGLGYALDLGLELVRLLADDEKAKQIKASIQYDQC